MERWNGAVVQGPWTCPYDVQACTGFEKKSKLCSYICTGMYGLMISSLFLGEHIKTLPLINLPINSLRIILKQVNFVNFVLLIQNK